MYRLSAIRLLCTQLSKGEQQIIQTLRARFPKANVDVKDVSGGCGAMYEVNVADAEFKGLPLVKQHQLVNQALKEEIKDMHGIRITTRAMS